MALAVRLIGFVVAFAILGIAVWKGSADLPRLAWSSPHLWVSLTVALCLYVLSQLLAAFAWARTLEMFSVKLPIRRAATQLLVSQIGKYIPGNIAHFLGRLALARADGVAAATVGLALLVEVGLVIAAGGLLLSVLLLLAPDIMQPMLSGLSAEIRTWLLTAATIALVVCVAACCWIVLARARLQAGPTAFALGKAVPVFLLHICNFVILGMSLSLTVQAVAPGAEVGYFLPMSVFAGAWTIGFLTPGAPGGIGIREGLIALGLGVAIGDGSALATAIVHRALAVLGDLIAFLTGIMMRSAEE